MRKPILPIIALALMLAGFSIATPIHAQTEATWFWATTPDGLVAYTLDGQINQVLADSTLNKAPLQGTRLSSDTALLYDEASRTVYFASSNAATSASLNEQFDVFSIVEYRPPYVLFTGARSFPAAGILNIETMTISPLTGFVGIGLPAIVFVDDTTLRYYSYAASAPGRDTPSALYERDLLTGAETPLLSFDYSSYGVFHSQDGQQWWILGPFSSDTHRIEDVTTYGEVDPAIAAAMPNLGTRVESDWIMTLDFLCQLDCPVTVTPLKGGDTRTFTLPTNQSGQFPLIRASLADGTLLIYHIAAQTLYRLDPEGNLLELGSFNFQNMSGWLLGGERWVIALGQGEHETVTYRLWEMTTGQLVYEASLDNFVTAAFAQDTVLILNGRYFSLYYVDTLYDLSAYEGYFFQPLENGQVLYQSGPNQAMEQGVYLYDAPGDTLTLLMPEGRGIPLQELNSPN